MPQTIFLSAVSAQFKDCREKLSRDLRKVGAEVVVQEDFTQGGFGLLRKLEGLVAGCDKIITLVGSAYGWAPELNALPDNAPERSYAQWEYHFALGERLDGSRAPAKPVYVYFATSGYLQDHTVDQSVVEAQRQQAFIDAIKASGKDRNEFSSLHELRALVLLDGFKLPELTSKPQNLPYDSLGSLFKGRDTLIDDIRTSLSSGGVGQATAIVAKQAIHGLGGVGKTRLAVEYAWQSLAEYTACLFVTADAPENLRSNLAALCRPMLLDLPEQQEPEQERQLAAVLRWLDSRPGWLLILDNVDSSEAAGVVDELLPRLKQGHVLITSRLSNWGGGTRSLELDTLDEKDAIAFLLEKTAERRTRTDEDEKLAYQLAQTLDGLALALEQAGAFINRKHIGLAEYLQRWRQQEQKLRLWFDAREMHYPKSLAVTWETSFGQLSSTAQALLDLLAWFAPAPIPQESFEGAFTPETLAVLRGNEATITPENTPPDLEDLLDELAGLSLLKWESGNQAFSIHRLVQEISQARQTDEAKEHALRSVFSLINHTLPVEPQSENDLRFIMQWASWIPHVRSLILTADQIGDIKSARHLMDRLENFTDSSFLMLGSALRGMLEINLIFMVRSGYEPPEMRTAKESYKKFLMSLGRSEREAKKSIESLIESVKRQHKPLSGFHWTPPETSNVK